MSTGAAGAAAAAEQARRLEEEEMTPYTADNLGGEWEFKILRSQFNTFRKPEKLREVLDQEARAGWVLLEKFDDQRIRLKRPVSARALDAKLDFDPYRTTAGVGEGAAVLLVLAIIFGIIFAIVGLVAGLRTGNFAFIVLALTFLTVPLISFLAYQRRQSSQARPQDQRLDDF